MRIAVCISGQPRFLERGYNQIFDKIISKYNNIDFFIHTWWSDDMYNDQLVKGYNKNKVDDFNNIRKCHYEINTLELIMKYYKPVIILNEPQIEFDTYENVNYETGNPLSLHSQFYSVKISNNLKKIYEKKNNFKYDIVIRSRFDIIIDKFDIDLNNINSSHIYTHSLGNGFPNDQLAVSSSETMDYYCDIFDKIDDYYNEGFKEFVGERILKHHLNEKLLLTDKIKNDIIKN